MRRAAHVDENQPEIVEALRKAGAIVESLAAVGRGVPDLVAQYHGRLYLLEVKSTAGKLRPSQREWAARGWRVSVVRTVEEALGAVGCTTRRGIS